MSYLIKVSRERMPGSCMGGTNYYRIALLEVEPGTSEVKMISKRAKGVVGIIHEWRRLYRGSTAKSKFSVAMDNAKAMLEYLENSHPQTIQDAGGTT